MSYGLKAYKNVALKTSGQEQVLLMLYQSAIKSCKRAILAIENNDTAKKGEYIGQLQDIVIELNSALDFETGGKMAEELETLYNYILFSSTQANINKESKPLEGCLSVLVTLYDGWIKAIDSLSKKDSP